MVYKKKPKHPYPLAQVTWVDAETSHGWETDGETTPSVPTVTTVGFLIYQDEDLVSIASTVGERTHNSRISIPKGMIKDLKLL